ncbi:inhibin beta chain [Nylanderia fulva]|uniref:inhibin beta chain n=1 Tax=Nylanderia fulva TaxID=613905 RepID=UPI0010FAD0BF|nr:inhibin beta chain [Nylanderia fulva]
MHQVPYRTERGGTSSEGPNHRNFWKQQHQQQQQPTKPPKYGIPTRVLQQQQQQQQQQQPSRSSRIPVRTVRGRTATRRHWLRRHRDAAGPDVLVRDSPPLHYSLGRGAPPFLPSNLLLIGLALCCLALPAVQPRLNGHYQTCPGCPQQQTHQQHQQQQHNHHHHHHHHHVHHDDATRSGGFFKGTTAAPTLDDLRLEAIKHQILQKLGLRSRPDVNRTLSTVPRNLALQTLYRAEAQTPPLHSDRSRVNESEHSAEFSYNGEKYSYKNLDRETTTTEGNARTTARSSYQGYDNVQEELDDFYARTSEIITFAEPGHTLNGQPLLEFPMSSGEPALEPLRIKRATLWARVELKHSHHYQHHRHNQINQRNITLWVFRVHCGNTTHLRGKELGQHLEMVTSLVMNVGQLGWQKFDVTKVVSRWYTTSYSKDKLTLLVDCSGCGSHVHVSTFDGYSPHVIESSLNTKGTEHDSDRPFLVVRTDPAAVKRVRRRAIECSGAIKGQCCKERFYVSFSQLGWDDWIIAPQGYYANYCRGDCAAGHRTPDTFLNYYTHVIEEYRKMDQLAGMQPCCAPLKFSPMSLIYYGPDSNIIKRDLPKMVVDECGCP